MKNLQMEDRNNKC